MNNGVLSVTELSVRVKGAVEKNPELEGVAVRGEISNITYHGSGHIYFSLKDSASLINAVFFKYANKSLDMKLTEGMSVVASGSVSVYEKRSSYQLIVKSVFPEGAGALQLKIEQLRKELAAEGVFDAARKRPLPVLPATVGVATSPTGAAFKDIVKVISRRYPDVRILLAPAVVQGEGAVASIIAAINELNREEHNVDVIIAGRGGGSFEDLAAFCEEAVVRAFANSRLPIISAVGHQIDHPLSDDAADAYAPTPSAAAEMAVPVKEELISKIRFFERIQSNAVGNMIEKYRHRIAIAAGKRVFAHPYTLIEAREQRLDDLQRQMVSTLEKKVQTAREKLASFEHCAHHIRLAIVRKKNEFGLLAEALDKLSPLKTLARGYTIVRHEKNGALIRSVSALNIDETVSLQFNDGRANCRVLDKKEGLFEKDPNPVSEF